MPYSYFTLIGLSRSKYRSRTLKFLIPQQDSYVPCSVVGLISSLFRNRTLYVPYSVFHFTSHKLSRFLNSFNHQADGLDSQSEEKYLLGLLGPAPLPSSPPWCTSTTPIQMGKKVIIPKMVISYTCWHYLLLSFNCKFKVFLLQFNLHSHCMLIHSNKLIHTILFTYTFRTYQYLRFQPLKHIYIS